MQNHNQKLRTGMVVLVIVVAVALLNNVLQEGSITGQFIDREEKAVTRVIDGDTILVEGGDRVRLLDIDTPERGEPCYKEAKDRLAELIDNRIVVLEKSGENKDQYDRLLRYVVYNNTNINVLLVREGMANTYFYNKNSPYYSQLIQAEQAAKSERLCVWKEVK